MVKLWKNIAIILCFTHYNIQSNFHLTSVFHVFTNKYLHSNAYSEEKKLQQANEKHCTYAVNVITPQRRQLDLAPPLPLNIKVLLMIMHQ